MFCNEPHLQSFNEVLVSHLLVVVEFYAFRCHPFQRKFNRRLCSKISNSQKKFKKFSSPVIITFIGEYTRQTEIRYFYSTFVVDHTVSSGKISVHEFFGGEICHPVADLLAELDEIGDCHDDLGVTKICSEVALFAKRKKKHGRLFTFADAN